MVTEALLTGTVSIAASGVTRLSGNAYVASVQPDFETDGSAGELPEIAIRDGDGGYIVLGIWKQEQLYGFVEIDTALLLQAFPRLGKREQIADLEVWLAEAPGVTPFHRLDTYPDISVDLALGAPARFSFSLPFKKRDPLRPTLVTRLLPAPQNSLGNPTGLRAITIQGAYLTDAGPARIPLITRGLSVGDASLATDGSLQISGGDRWSALERRVEAGFSIPPGSGLPRGVVFQDLAEHGHGWEVSGWQGTPMMHGWEVVNEEVMVALAELADADNRLIYVDNNVLTALPEVDTESPIAMVIGPRDLIAAEPVDVSSAGPNPPTQIEIGGQQQVTRDENGIRTIEKISKAWAPYQVKVALAVQDSAGNISATGAAEEAETFQLVNETTTRLTYEGDTLIVQETEVKGWYNPEVWRYTLDVTPSGLDGVGDYGSYHANAYLYDSTATRNDQTPTYRWNRQRFGTVGRQTETHHYDARGFLTQTHTVKEGWLIHQEAVKFRANKGIAWDVTNHLGVEILANGIAAKYAVYGGGERFAGTYSGTTPGGGFDKIERTRTNYSVTDDGYITRAETQRIAWGADSGSTGKYEYGDGTQRDRAEFALIEVEKVVEQYEQEGDVAFKTTTRTGLGGRLLEATLEPIDGYFPTATQRVDLEPDPALYVGREDLLASARAASRRETKPIRYDVISAALESRYQRSVLREDFALAEDQADLERRADVLLALHSAQTCNFNVPANFLLRPGIRVQLQHPEIDLDSPVHVVAVSHQRSGGNPLVTRCQGRIYVA